MAGSTSKTRFLIKLASIPSRKAIISSTQPKSGYYDLIYKYTAKEGASSFLKVVHEYSGGADLLWYQNDGNEIETIEVCDHMNNYGNTLIHIPAATISDRREYIIVLPIAMLTELRATSALFAMSLTEQYLRY